MPASAATGNDDFSHVCCEFPVHAIRYVTMRTRDTAILTTLFFVTLVGLSPVTAQQQVEPDHVNFYRNTVSTSLAPESPFSGVIAAALRELNPRVGIEVSLVISVTEEAFSNAGYQELMTILQAVSTMQGINYWSASREEFRTLYLESYRVASPSQQDPLPDLPGVATADATTLFAFQRDGTFGGNVYQLDYRAGPNHLLMTMENATTMTYRVVPMVRPGNLQTFVLVEFRESTRELFFYGNIAVRVPTILGLEERARNSFYNRIVAIQGWFVDQLDARNLLR